MAITPLPSAPLTTDSQAEFDTKAFAFVAALEDFVTEANNLASDVNGDAVSAAADAASAAASWDSFDDRYLGAKASDPTLDNDGNALLTGALYFNTASNVMKVYSGSAWLTAASNLASPGPIGGTTPSTGAFTTVTVGAGTAAAPAITTTGDTNNGIFFPATDVTAITTAGAERVRVDASGNVGIGTSSPVYKLVVNNATTYSSVSGQTSSNTVGHFTSEAACNFWLDSYTTGNPGIIGRKANGSSTTPSATAVDNPLLTITGRGYGATTWSSSGVAAIIFNAAENFTDTAQGSYIKFETAPTGSTTRAERMRITSTGNVEFKNGITETVFTITDAAGFEINPANGTIQLITLGASRTPAATSFAAGQSVLLMVNDGTAYTITWSTIGVVWVGGTAPTLATTGYTVIELWKVASTVYGAHVGNVA